MSDTNISHGKRSPDLTRTIQGCPVRLFFDSEDNTDALRLSQSMLSTSYAKKIFSFQSAALVDNNRREWDNDNTG